MSDQLLERFAGVFRGMGMDSDTAGRASQVAVVGEAGRRPLAESPTASALPPVDGFDRVSAGLRAFGLSESAAAAAAARPFAGDVAAARQAWSGPLRAVASPTGPASGAALDRTAAIEAVTAAAQANSGMPIGEARAYACELMESTARSVGEAGALRVMATAADALLRESGRRPAGAR
jgi:hypothetical protein